MTITQLSIPVPKAMWTVLVQFFYFAVVGAAGTSSHYVTLIWLVQALGLSPVLASAAGFACGAFVNYLLNHRYTFHSNKRHRVAILQFFMVAVTGLGFNTLIMTLAVCGLGLAYLLAQAVATALVLVWNFAANRCWTFKERRYAGQ